MDLAIVPGCYRINFLKIISIIVPVVLALIILFGTLGNGLVLFVVTFKQQMRNTTNILILVSWKRISNILKHLSQKIDSRFCVIFIYQPVIHLSLIVGSIDYFMLQSFCIKTCNNSFLNITISSCGRQSCILTLVFKYINFVPCKLAFAQINNNF